MRVNPHLVLDGAVARGRARRRAPDRRRGRPRRAAARMRLSRPPSTSARAAGEREQIELVSVPERFVAGEESALVQWLNGGPAKPTFAPPRPFERGVRGRPTLVQNVETLANIALIARYGADWFRELGSRAEPGSLLVTLGGAVGAPRRHRARVRHAAARRCSTRYGGVDRAGRRPLLVGGYFGTWVPVGDGARRPALGRRPAAARRLARRALDRRAARRPAAACARPRGSPTTWRARAPASAARASSGCAPSPTRCTRSRSATPAHRGALARLRAPRATGHRPRRVRASERRDAARRERARPCSPTRSRIISRASARRARTSRCCRFRRRPGSGDEPTDAPICASTRSAATPTATAPSCCPS